MTKRRRRRTRAEAIVAFLQEGSQAIDPKGALEALHGSRQAQLELEAQWESLRLLGAPVDDPLERARLANYGLAREIRDRLSVCG